MTRSRLRWSTGAAARVGAAVAACLTAAVVAAPGAAAAGDQWWVTGFNLAQNHTVADGSGVTVAVLDSTLSPSAPSLAGVDLVPPSANECLDESGGAAALTGDGPTANHATQMVSVLAGKGASGGPLGPAPGAKVLFYNIGTSSADGKTLVCDDSGAGTIADNVEAAAINDAVAKGARVISMSFGGGSLSAVSVAIAFAERKGVVFVASTNDQATGDRVDQPAIFNGVVAVNAIDRDSKLITNAATGPQWGPLVTVTGPGKDMAVGGYTAPGTWDPSYSVDGTSTATAFVAGVLATTLSKYPTATGNQLIQSLARNTGGDQHDLGVRGTDGFGFGTVSLTSMLQNDPTAYPDENPLLRDGAQPPTSDILGTSSAPPSSPAPASSGAASSPAASSTPVAAADDGGSSTGLMIGIVIGVVVLLAIVALIVVLVRRGRRTGAPPGAGGPPPVPSGYR